MKNKHSVVPKEFYKMHRRGTQGSVTFDNDNCKPIFQRLVIFSGATAKNLMH
jgi:hypothetical protein